MPKCKIENCTIKNAIFNYKNETKGIYCSKHKLDTMIDVYHKKCNHNNCELRPVFNHENESNGLYCDKHKLDNMTNIGSKKCKECKKQPSYNYENETIAIYCIDHMKEKMINIKCKKCKECNKQPSYNYENETIAIYCTEHKKYGMVNIYKKCLEPECHKIPCYNYDAEKKALYCNSHKKKGMINIKSRKCINEGCNLYASYNYENETYIYCGKHALDGMINVRNKKCKTYMCDTLVGNKYKGYCQYCFINLFPDEKVSRNYQTKERNVADYVLSFFQNMTIIADKRIKDGCSRRRPDLLLDLGYQIIIVEVDENQHIDYYEGDCSCENKRLMEISQDVGHRPIVFIRFNPDEYDDVKSCFTIGKDGICKISKRMEKEWEKRLNVLTDRIQYYIDHKIDKIIEVIHLFYDTK